jgi:2,3-bisphosphoglycerate-independent phosphoglycerate mutase
MPSRVHPLVLIILDGWGIAPAGPGNAITAVQTPSLDALARAGATSTLDAAGEAVGLPDGQIGNSEVGHLNLGAGFRVMQDLPRIDAAIRDGSFASNPALVGAVRHALESPGRTLHLIGLFSHGGVHSHARHLDALIRLAEVHGLDRVAVHVILDGRDTPPRQALEDLPALEATLRETGVGRIATVTGRYYAMDRDKRWDRVARAYATVVEGVGPRFGSARAIVEEAYAKGTNDEFVEPAAVGDPIPVIDGDSVIVANFRADRVRELCHALLLPDFDGFPRHRVAQRLHVVTFGEYEVGLPVAGIAFPPQHVDAPLARVVSDAGLTQCHLAETEKYAHVTFFFNGGVEAPFPGEVRILVPSPKVATYDLQPEMSAMEVAGAAAERIAANDDAFVVVNFANGDMVGHTGVMTATQAAVKAVDEAVGVVVEAARHRGRIVMVTSDHGNAEMMVDPATGGAWTAHTTNPVPLIVIGAPAGTTLRPTGDLSNVAPTILRLMGLPVPRTMTSPDLFAE